MLIVTHMPLTLPYLSAFTADVGTKITMVGLKVSRLGGEPTELIPPLYSVFEMQGTILARAVRSGWVGFIYQKSHKRVRPCHHAIGSIKRGVSSLLWSIATPFHKNDILNLLFTLESRSPRSPHNSATLLSFHLAYSSHRVLRWWSPGPAPSRSI